MNAKSALILALIAIAVGIAAVIQATLTSLQARDLATQLSATQDALQSLQATNQDLSDSLSALEHPKTARARPAAGALGNPDTDMTNELNAIEGRLNALDGGPQSVGGVKTDIAQIKSQLSLMSTRLDDLSRRH